LAAPDPETGTPALLGALPTCRVVDRVAGRIPVIAGTGANSTSEAVRLTEDARDVGADACLLVTPYYNKPTQEGLYQHYRFIAEAGRKSTRLNSSHVKISYAVF